jgi:hypothetical protein
VGGAGSGAVGVGADSNPVGGLTPPGAAARRVGGSAAGVAVGLAAGVDGDRALGGAAAAR